MVAIAPNLGFLAPMSDTPHPVEPTREIIAPRHESLVKEFQGEVGPRKLEFGEARLWLVARDPRWVFAYWEFVPSEHPEATGADGIARFSLRILGRNGAIETETEIHPDQGNIYLPVNDADSNYIAELGFYAKSGVWCFIAKSGTTYTPPNENSEEGVVEFAKIPATLPLGSVHKIMRREPAASGLARVQRFSEWTRDQERMLISLLAADVLAGGKPEGRAARARSRMVPRPPAKEIPLALWAQLDAPATSSPSESPSSWHQPEFPLHLNAELIFYGGTAPNASLTIAGKPVHLRHDGTFRVHCRLPDGEFEIPIVARSADGTRTRNAVLRFSRETEADPGTGASKQPDYLPASPPVG